MNDITALAQREKFEAWMEEAEALPWGYLKKRRTSDEAYHEPGITDMWGAWQAASAELLEALEARDKQIEDYAARLNRLEKRCDHKGSVYWDVSGVKRCARCGIGIQVIEGEA
ncbi:TPA: hypothetical protein PFE08_004074 [Kluyvera ascorbata]|nr:hypothetical protein [Kluyvera ascorbata]HDG1706397.1 hypothetical protein [Kluyvera ascorbata]